MTKDTFGERCNISEHTGDEREYQDYLDERREEEEHEAMDRPLYIVKSVNGERERGAFNQLADAGRFVLEFGGDIYELLGTSTANHIEREDNLAEAARLTIRALWWQEQMGSVLNEDASRAYNACQSALAAHEAYLAECRALEPKEEERG